MPTIWNANLDDSHHSWCALVLPFLEEQGLRDLINGSAPAMSVANQSVGARVIPSFKCPDYAGSDYSRAPTYLNIPSADGTSGDTRYAIGNYVAMGAIDVVALWRLEERDQDLLGIMHPTSETRHKNILDGSSHTFLVVESREEDMRVWIDGRAAAYTSLPEPDHLQVPSLNFTPYYRHPGELSAEYGPSSQHHGGANHLFADGSAQFVTDDVSLKVYTARTTFQGMEIPAE